MAGSRISNNEKRDRCVQVSELHLRPSQPARALLFRVRLHGCDLQANKKDREDSRSWNLPCPILLASLLSTGYQCSFNGDMIGSGSYQPGLCYFLSSL